MQALSTRATAISGVSTAIVAQDRGFALFLRYSTSIGFARICKNGGSELSILPLQIALGRQLTAACN